MTTQTKDALHIMIKTLFRLLKEIGQLANKGLMKFAYVELIVFLNLLPSHKSSNFISITMYKK